MALIRSMAKKSIKSSVQKNEILAAFWKAQLQEPLIERIHNYIHASDLALAKKRLIPLMDLIESYSLYNNENNIQELREAILKLQSTSNEPFTPRSLSRQRFMLAILHFFCSTEEDLKVAKNYLRPLDKRDALVLCMLGRIYAIEGNIGEARDYFLLAESLNDIAVKGFLGLAYLNGFVFEQDYQKAKLNLYEAATAGDSTARCTIGRMHLNGEGTPCNHKLARVNFGMAIRFFGNPEALSLIGIMNVYSCAAPNFEKAVCYLRHSLLINNSDEVKEDLKKILVSLSGKESLNAAIYYHAGMALQDVTLLEKALKLDKKMVDRLWVEDICDNSPLPLKHLAISSMMQYEEHQLQKKKVAEQARVSQTGLYAAPSIPRLDLTRLTEENKEIPQP